MALAKQFYSSFKSYNGWDYYLEIWVEGYSGSASEITLGAGGPVITYGTDEQDRFSSILSSKLELPFMVTNTTEDAFVKNIREQFNEQDVYIHLYRESSSGYSSVAPLWSGFVLMDLSASPDLYYPYPVTLTAVDGLSLLKEIDFVQSGTAGSYTDSDMYSSNGRFTYWIKEILLKSGASTTAEGSTQDYKFTTAINWFNSVMPTITQSTDPFYQTKCNTQMFFSKDANDNFTVVNCYDVLKNLLKHWGARIIYWKHIYYIVQIQEYNTAESGTYANPDNIDTRTYTKTGAFDGSSDNLGDSYWTRYNLLIDDVTGGIQKLTGTQFNYLPQLKRTQANFIDYGNKNYFGGLPFDLTTGQNDVIKQATLVDVSTDGTMILIIPLDVTMVTQYQGVLNMLLYFRLYITDGVTTYYLRYDPSNTPKYYWEDDSNINLNTKRTFWRSQLDNIVGTQTKVGFHQQVDFVDVNGTSLTLNGEWDLFTDIDNWGSNNANNGSFEFLYGYGLLTTNAIYTPSATTIYWTNTLNSAYQSPLNLSIIGTTTQPSAYNPSNSLNPTTQNNIVTYTTSLNQNPFEGKLLIVNTSSSGALYGSFVSVSPSTTTNDSQIVDFGELIWGDTLLASSEGSLKVWNGSSFVKSNVTGTWGLGSTSGTNSFTEMLLSEYLYGQTKVIESPSMRLVIGETNKNQNDGSGSRPNYVNPIGRLKGYSATGTTPYYIFKSGSFHLLKDEIDYQGYQIIRDTQTLTKTDDVIIGPDILQDKTNIIGQKTPQTNSLINKVTQNSFITTTSALKSAYGNDIAVNGIFASDTGWTKGTGWSIASNKASFSPTGSASDIKQDTLTNALTYKIVVSLTLSAGALSVKAGSSGNATVLSSSGTYEIFSTCAGSTEVIFEASAAFEGYIEKVVVQQQVPVTSISINAIGEAVFKTNDVLNIADVDGSDVNQFTVSSDQGASDTSIAVTSKLISEDILEGSIILVNQNDLAAQYQNKTKGTVGGFDITATSIDSGSVAISSYIDDDTFATASATSLATSESIKAYVDTQVGSADTLSEVLANGNTTGGTDIVVSSGDKIIGPSVFEIMSEYSNRGRITLLSSTAAATTSQINFLTDGNVRAGITKQGNFLINTTTDSGEKLRVEGNVFIHNSNATLKIQEGTAETYSFVAGGTSLDIKADSTTALSIFQNAYVGIGTSSPSYLLTVDSSNSSGPDNVAFFNSASNNERILIGSVNQYIEHKGSEQRITLASEGSAGTFTVRTNGSERARITSDGRLGIGTSSPSSLLEVNGNTTTGNHFPLLDNVYDLGAPTVRWEKLYTQNISDIGTGNVGIGTTNPTEKLHVVGDALITGDSHADAFKPAVSGNPIKFKNFDSSTEFARITDSGNVLIGGTTDLNSAIKLQLTNSADNRIQITTSNGFSDASLDLCNTSDNKGWRVIHRNNTNFEIQYASSLSSGIIGGVSTALAIDSSLNTTLSGSLTGTTATFSGQVSAGTHFKLQSGGKLYSNASNVTLQSASGSYLGFNISTSEKMRLNDTGLGIGTTSPVGRLTVIDSTASSTLQKFHVGRGTTAGLSITDDDATAYIKAIQDENESGYGNLTLMADDQNNKDGYISFNGTAGVERARITSGGNLLIGTTTDSGSKLTVAGNTNISGVLYIDYISTRSGTNIDFRHQDGTTKMQLKTATGNLLIGTTTDSGDKLVVKTDGSANAQSWYSNNNLRAYINASGDFYSNRFRAMAGSQSYPPISFDSANKWGFWYSSGLNIITNQNIAATFTSGGNVLIGTTTDDGSSKLQVNGDAKFFGGGLFTTGSYLKLNDSITAFFGTGNDLRIWHNGSNSYISQEGTGDLYIRNLKDDKDIIFQSDNGSGGLATYITLDGSSARTVFSKEARFSDNVVLSVGSGQDLKLLHDGTDSLIDNFTGHLYFRNYADDKDIIFQSDDGSGGVTAYITLDGSAGYTTVQKHMVFADSASVYLGTGADLQLAHDGSNSTIQNNVGNLTIRQDADDSDIVFKCDNGTGGVANYITLDGSQTTINLEKTVLIGTTTNTGAYKIDVAGKQRVQDTLELDDVLMLNAISTPSDPAAGKSVIYMDSSDGGIKCKINVGGTVVTRTIASFE